MEAMSTTFSTSSEVTGQTYQVEFRWLQTAISLRHSDTVDVKFLVNGAGKVVALLHGPLEQACREAGLRLSDTLCAKVAARFLREALESGAATDQDLLTPPPERIGKLVRAEALPGRS